MIHILRPGKQFPWCEIENDRWSNNGTVTASTWMLVIEWQGWVHVYPWRYPAIKVRDFSNVTINFPDVVFHRPLVRFLKPWRE